MRLERCDAASEDRLGADLDRQRFAEIEQPPIEVQKVRASVDVAPVAEHRLAREQTFDVLVDRQRNQSLGKKGLFLAADADRWASGADAGCGVGHGQQALNRIARSWARWSARVTSGTGAGLGRGSTARTGASLDAAGTTSNSLMTTAMARPPPGTSPPQK